MKASDTIKKKIKAWEGLRLIAYLCPAGVLTIGYGHTGSDVKKDMSISKAKAEDLLDADIAKVEKQIAAVTSGFTLTQGQWDALVSFTFNLGIANLKSSTLLKKLKVNPNDATIPAEFRRWNKAKVNGAYTELAGLTARRAAEAEIYQG